MQKLNYQKLMSLNPVKIGAMVNGLQQKIEFFENPIHGQDAPVIAVYASYAYETDFFDLDDLTSPDYEDYHLYFYPEGCMHIFELNDNLGHDYSYR